MLTLPICIIVLLPQAMAALWRKGPAAHLTLLLLGMCAVTTLMAALAIRAAAPALSGDSTAMSPLVWPVLGLCLLVPFYWTVEHICAARDLRVEAVLVQTLALTLTAALWSEAHIAPAPGIDFAALALVLALFTRGLSLLARTMREK